MTDITLYVVFSRFKGFKGVGIKRTITKRPKEKRPMQQIAQFLLHWALCNWAFCFGRFITLDVLRVNEKILNLEKTTSSVLSVLLLIYGLRQHVMKL